MQGDLTGQVLDGRYLLQERLGAGGMGEVWRCRDQRIGRDVAVKLLLDVRLNAELEARFEREARVAGGLSSPHIVTLHDYGHGALAGRDVPYLVMELLQGRTLAQIRNDERTSRRVLTWGAQVCAALEVAHRAGVVHRDVKPGNVMITDDGGLKVLDFGIARVIEDGHTRAGLTADGTVIGTADYMAPEQAAGQPADARSDLYSFGCLLYFLVTARPPFTADTFYGMLQKQLNETPEPPGKHRPGLPPELDRLILALLAKDPAARPPGAKEVREALEAMLPAPSQGTGSAGAAAAVRTGEEPTKADPAVHMPTAAVGAAGGGGAAAAGAVAPAVAGQSSNAVGGQAPGTSGTPAGSGMPATPSTVGASGSTGGAGAAQGVEQSGHGSGFGSGTGPQPVAAVMASGPVGPPSTIPPHVPMQPPTHPPTQIGEFDPTRVVPAEFGGRGVAATEETKKPKKAQKADKADSAISRRKLLLGVGGLAGVAVAGGGAYLAVGSKDSKDKGGSNVANGSTETSPSTSAPSNAAAAVPSGSASPADSDSTTSSSSSSPSSSPSPSDSAGEPSSAAGAQPPLNPGAAPVGKIAIPGQPNISFQYINGGKHLVVSDTANGVQIFDVSNPAGAVKVINIPTPLANGKLQAMLSMSYNAARGVLALGGAGGLSLWDVKDPTKPVQLSARGDVNGKAVSDLGFNSDGTKLVIATDESDNYFSDKPVGNCVMDVTDPRQPAQLSGLTPPDHLNLNMIAFASADKYIVSTGKGDNGQVFQLWDAQDLKNVRPVDSASWRDANTTKLTSTMWVDTNGPWKTLVLGVVSADNNSQDLQFLDFGKPQTPAKQTYFQTTSGAVAFHPTRPIVAIGDSRSGAAVVYDMSNPSHPTQMARLVADAGDVETLGFNPDGSLLTMALRRDENYSDSNAVMYFWKM
ncbi:MAG: protein kinase [Catenulispora sp.]|nr:protein kinase [Catenulispora sp.]